MSKTIIEKDVGNNTYYWNEEKKTWYGVIENATFFSSNFKAQDCFSKNEFGKDEKCQYYLIEHKFKENV